MDCSPYAAAETCNAGSTSDTSSCVCNAGYAGDGRVCTGTCLECNCNDSALSNKVMFILPACRSCSLYATMETGCSSGSKTDTVSCKCNAGYYGDGFVCTPCRSCHEHGTLSNACQHGSTVDSVTCACNSGYFGDGVKCSECKRCHSKAVRHGECSPGSTTDTVECKCNVGFVGDGVQCSISRSHNFDLVLETRKNYFYWAKQLEKRLPFFKTAKDAYVAAASSFTEWLYEAGGGRGTGKGISNADHSQTNLEREKQAIDGRTRVKMRMLNRQIKRSSASSSSGTESSKIYQKIYAQLKRRQDIADQGPIHDVSGTGRGRHHNLNSNLDSSKLPESELPPTSENSPHPIWIDNANTTWQH